MEPIGESWVWRKLSDALSNNRNKEDSSHTPENEVKHSDSTVESKDVDFVFHSSENNGSSAVDIKIQYESETDEGE